MAAHRGPWGRLVPVKGVRHGAPVMARGRRTRSHSAAASGAGGFGARPTADTNRAARQGSVFRLDLSTPPGQACAVCHAPETGFTGPDSAINAGQAVYPGAVHVRAGNRKPPTSAYGGDSPVMTFDSVEGLLMAACSGTAAPRLDLGDSLAEQALGPFLNDLERHASRQAGVPQGEQVRATRRCS